MLIQFFWPTVLCFFSPQIEVYGMILFLIYTIILCTLYLRFMGLAFEAELNVMRILSKEVQNYD